jgi:hypothetical protein
LLNVWGQPEKPTAISTPLSNRLRFYSTFPLLNIFTFLHRFFGLLFAQHLLFHLFTFFPSYSIPSLICVGIFKQSMGARNRVGIGLSYRPAMLHSLAALIPCDQFLGSLKV